MESMPIRSNILVLAILALVMTFATIMLWLLLPVQTPKTKFSPHSTPSELSNNPREIAPSPNALFDNLRIRLASSRLYRFLDHQIDLNPPQASNPSATSKHFHPNPHQTKWSQSFLDTYKHWDSEWVNANMVETANPVALEELVDWFHTRLGDCGSPSPIAHRGDDYARFAYTCDNGALEAGFIADKESPDTIRRLLLGARSIEPASTVQRAGEQALQFIETWDRNRFHDLFCDVFDPHQMETFFHDVRIEYGLCRIETLDLASARGAIWYLACEQAPALMKVDLDNEDRIHRFFIKDRPKKNPKDNPK